MIITFVWQLKHQSEGFPAQLELPFPYIFLLCACALRLASRALADFPKLSFEVSFQETRNCDLDHVHQNQGKAHMQRHLYY